MGMRLDVKHVGAVSKLHWARHCTVMAMFRRPQQRVDSEYTSFSEIGRDEEGRNFDSLYKILIIGDAAVGKTALLTRYCEGRFQTTYMSTVGEHDCFSIALRNDTPCYIIVEPSFTCRY